MSQNLTKPEEIDQILNGMEWKDLKLRIPSADKNPSDEVDRKGGRTGLAYISPYRAAYMKSHRFNDR